MPRYIRALCTQGVSTGSALTDFQVRSTNGGTDQATVVSAIASASGSGTSPGDAFDGSPTTSGWAFGTGTSPATSSQEWIGQDFGSSVAVSEITMAWSTALGATVPTQVVLQQSDDGNSWTTFETDSSPGTSNTYSSLGLLSGSGGGTGPGTDASGSGSVTSAESSGSGVAVAPAALASGSGLREINGSGAATSGAATASGDGSREIVGLGAAVAPAALANGSGALSGDEITGSGAATAGVATASGTGAKEITGTGLAGSGAASATGSGQREITGSGAADAPVTPASGAGIVSLAGTTTGAGAATIGAAVISGSGVREVTALGATTGGAVVVASVGEVVPFRPFVAPAPQPPRERYKAKTPVGTVNQRGQVMASRELLRFLREEQDRVTEAVALGTPMAPIGD